MRTADAVLLPSAAGQHTGTAAPTRVETLGAAFAAALLGLTLLWGVGFSQIEAVHNAAHDTRHSTGFPCH